MENYKNPTPRFISELQTLYKLIYAGKTADELQTFYTDKDGSLVIIDVELGTVVFEYSTANNCRLMSSFKYCSSYLADTCMFKAIYANFIKLVVLYKEDLEAYYEGEAK